MERQTKIQGLWPNCIWRDKQNQCKDLVFESKTGKPNCILHKNSWLDFIQTYTSRRVAFLCIFLYMKSLSSEFHRSMHRPDIHHLPLNNCSTWTRSKENHTPHSFRKSHVTTQPKIFKCLILIAFSTGNSSLEPLIESLCAQFHVNLSWRVLGRNRTGDLTDY